MVKHFPSDFLVLFSSLPMFLRCVSTKKTAWRCASSSSGHRRRPTGSWASKMDGTPHVICLVVKNMLVKLENFTPIFVKSEKYSHQIGDISPKRGEHKKDLTAPTCDFNGCPTLMVPKLLELKDGWPKVLRCYQGTPPKTKSSPLKIHGWKMELLFEEICKFSGVPKSPTFIIFTLFRSQGRMSHNLLSVAW